MTEQRTDQWYRDRLGKITASRLGDVMAKPTTKRYQNYLQEVADERLGAVHFEDWKSSKLAQFRAGVSYEPQARGLYGLRRNVDVEEVGFVICPDLPGFGASPDGLVKEEGAVEIKTTMSRRVQWTRFRRGMESVHIPQVQGVLLATGRQWIDFVSYFPREVPEYQLYIQRIARDEGYIVRLQDKIREFDDRCWNLLKSTE